MTDRELLEKAAKAAWMWKEGFSLDDDDFPHFSTVHGFQLAWGKGWWNPLTNDGDALRLAVKLNMTLRCYMGNTCAQIGVPGKPNAYVDESDHADHLKATRRAIVRAAAAIGKQAP